MTRFGRICCTGLAIVFALGMLASCSAFGERVAQKVFPDLQTYFDAEAPPTATSYPASSSISAVIGGSGQGLSCSIPGALKWAMFTRTANEADISLQFRQACVYHDYCYRYGHATYGYTRANCDYALQQIAYRDCRIINLSNDPEKCRARARLVLLGVTLGGGKAFATGAKSAYFEFDPMPFAADDYVTVRWVRNAYGTTVNGRALGGQFVVMHYKRGTVRSRAAGFNSAVVDAGQPDDERHPMPSQFIPTPPLVIRSGSEDRLLAIARDNFQNTNIELVEYWPALGARRNNAIIRAWPEAIDVNASIFWFGGEHGDVLSYWSSSDQAFGTVMKGVAAGHSVKPLHGTYRMLQHMPVEGRFFDPGCLDTAVLKRGGVLDATDDDEGRGYDRLVHLKFVQPPSTRCPLRASLTLAATQELEPLGIARLDSGRDVLVAVRQEGAVAKLTVFDLARARGEIALTAEVKVLPAPLDPSWLRMPPQVLFDRGTRSSILFFSKFTGPTFERGDTNGIFQFQYFGLSGGEAGKALNVAPAGNGKCIVKLGEQARIVRPHNLGENIARGFPSPDKDGLADEKKTAAAILANMSERWANAQVIPGWFMQKTGIESETGPLDVAVFFRGYPQYAFLAAGHAGATDNRNGFQQVSQPYVVCE